MVKYKITYTTGKVVEKEFDDDHDAILYIYNEGDHVATYERCNN